MQILIFLLLLNICLDFSLIHIATVTGNSSFGHLDLMGFQSSHTKVINTMLF